MYDSEDVFELLIHHDQDLTLKHSLEIWKQSAIEKLESWWILVSA